MMPGAQAGLRGAAAGVLACAALGLALHFSPAGARLDGLLFDLEMRLLRAAFPAPAVREVLVVGIDEATVQKLPEPITLWHRHLGDFLRAAVAGEAAAVGLDIVLPDRSFNEVLPGQDEALLAGMLAARRAMPVVVGLTVDAAGRPRAVFRKFLLVAGERGTGLALFQRDPDLVLRRFDERLAEDGSAVPTFAGQLARGLGVEPGAGHIDFSVGPAFQYLPLASVLEWFRGGDVERLRRAFAGRPVLLGTVLPLEDEVAAPVPLAAWKPDTGLVPGVLLHAQALRSILGPGLIRPAPLAALALILAAALLWLARAGAAGAAAGFAALALLLFAAATGLMRAGWQVPLAGPLAAGFAALAGRAGLDALQKLRERQRLRRSFSGYVSPAVMQQILAGELSPELGGTRRFVCVLFADIRGFTTRSESMTPEAVIALLNRYFERAVTRIHGEAGAVISFMGDGIMAVFGAPGTLARPCDAGFAAAKAMQGEVALLNEELAAEGAPPVAIGVGLHAGDVVIGHVGARARHDYTAIGDAVNLASRLEGLTKEAHYQVVCSRVVYEALGAPAELVPLGAMPVKGHTPVEVYGWGPR